MNNYITWFERNNYNVEIRFVEGNGKAEYFENQQLTFGELKTKFENLIANKKIEHNDLKCRYDGCSVDIKNKTKLLTVHVGITDYFSCINDIENNDETLYKINLGSRKYNDPKYYLSCGIGVTVVPYTLDGYALLGIHKGSVYKGDLEGLSGWLPFEYKVSLINPAAHARIEYIEELGVDIEQPLEFLGLISYKNTYETEFVFGLQISNQLIENIIIKQEWKNAQDACEHENFVLVAFEESNNLKIMPATEFGIQNLSKKLSLKKILE